MELTYDKEYTDELVNNIIERYGGSGVKRVGTHVSDLTGPCLRASWGKHNIPEDQWLQEAPEDSPMVMWSQGLQFEDLIGPGTPQVPKAYCPSCNAISTVPPPTITDDGLEEVAKCTVCKTRWLIGTPDYNIDGIIHEVKQTRKSQRHGPANAPWWIEQIKSYMFFARISNADARNWGRLVVNWLMGDYGSKKKGERPRPPRSAIEAFKVSFDDTEWPLWKDELLRRKQIVEGPTMPPLNGMGEGDERSPAYDWACSSCPVGKAMGCEMFIWDDDDQVISKEEVLYTGYSGDGEVVYMGSIG